MKKLLALLFTTILGHGAVTDVVIQQRNAAGTFASRTITGSSFVNGAVGFNGSGVLVGVDLVGSYAQLGAANSWADGIKQTFNPSATTAGFNVGSVAGDPSAPSNGDGWYDSTANELTFRINGVNVALGAGGGGELSDGDKGDITVSSSGTVWVVDANSISLTTDTTGSYMADLVGTATEIDVSHAQGEASTATISLPSAIDIGGKTSFEIPNAAAPTVSVFGQIAGDNNLWAASRGAPIFYDGTASTALINVLVSDTPSNGQVPTWNTGGTITWESSAPAVATDTIWDAAGDLPVGTGSNTAARLAMGTANQVLRVNAGATTLEWADSVAVTDGDKGDITVSASGATWTIDSADLQAIDALTTTAVGRAILDDADAAAMRNTLGATAGAWGADMGGTGRSTLTSNAILTGNGTSAVGFITPGTGVATALAVNVGSAGAPVLFNGAGGTPSSITLTNASGTAASLTAGSVTTNANLTGHITSTGNAAILGSFSFTQLNTALTGDDAAGLAAANAFTGVNSFAGAVIHPSAAMTGSVLNVTKMEETRSVTGNVTFTLSATPGTDTWFGFTLTADASGPYTLTWPAGTWKSAARGGGTITTSTLAASERCEIQVRYDGTNYWLYGDPIQSFFLNGSASGVTILQATAVASGSLTLPAATDTLVGKATTDVLTNKTLTGPIIGAAGVSLTGDGDGAITFLGLGDGSDENLTLNLDDTSNTGVLSSSTGLVLLDTGTIGINLEDATLEIPNASDPDVATEGFISWDANGDWMRAYDGTAQVAIARKIEALHCTVVLPNDLADSERDAFWMWSNESGMSFIITGWKVWSDTDDTTLNIEEIDADGANNATVDAVEVATNGTAVFTGADTTITAATIENGHLLVLDFDDTDTPGQVKVTIYGYYAADVN